MQPHAPSPASTSRSAPTGDASFGDLIAGEDVEPSEEVHVSLAEDAVRSAVETLPEREREIVKLRYGMNGDPDPKSLEEIGRTLGLTRERVRQIEARALQRLAERREVAALGDRRLESGASRARTGDLRAASAGALPAELWPRAGLSVAANSKSLAQFTPRAWLFRVGARRS